MTYVFVGLFLIMMVYISYFQIVQSKDIINSSYNTRLDSMADRVVRGKILDRNGNVLAQTIVDEDGSETRDYPYGRIFAHVIGYNVKGKSGLESVENFDLLTSDAFIVERIRNELAGQKNQGDNVITTLDAVLQEAAYDALGDMSGAVIVMEPSTGKILAMVSKPDFNPNYVADNWDELTGSDSGQLLNRATQGLYVPGSTFKIVTALEFMRENSNYTDYLYDCTGEITVDDVTVHCAGNQAHGVVNLRDSLAYSCNTSFSNIGLSLDIESFNDTAEDLLFNHSLPSVLPYSKSSFTLSEEDSVETRMHTAMGQGNTAVTPYHMALITAAIANDGVLMRPYLVDSVTNYQGTLVEENEPSEYQRLMTISEAATLKDYMTSVVEYGTATSLSGRGYSVAGKTGTAEYSSDKEKNHSWFVGMSNVDNPDLVISVVIESADGAARAVNIARQVFDTYYY